MRGLAGLWKMFCFFMALIDAKRLLVREIVKRFSFVSLIGVKCEV